MSGVASSPIVPVDDEKNPGYFEEKNQPHANASTIKDDDVSSADGDDALKLAGTHAEHFDDKYYLRVRRKIVSSPS